MEEPRKRQTLGDTLNIQRKATKISLCIILVTVIAVAAVIGFGDIMGRNPYIPDGFTYIEGEPETGYIIEDENQNQFVWIPVIDFTRYDFDMDIKVDDDDPIQRIFYGEGRRESVIYGGEYDIREFKASVAKYSGFYISRFEIGDGQAEYPRGRGSSAIGKTGTPVSKAGVYPYTFVTRDEALEICNTFIRDERTKSTLASSYAWDMTMQHLGCDKSELSAKNSNTTRKDPDKTGEGNDAVKGIMDLAGNVSEWTTEYSSNAYYDYHDDCVMRGNNFSDEEYSAVTRNCNSNVRNEFIGFRMVLYRTK